MGRDARSVSFGMRHVSKSEFMGGNPFHIFPRNEKWISICRENIAHICNHKLLLFADVILMSDVLPSDTVFIFVIFNCHTRFSA